MKHFRKFLCWLFGHRSICLHRRLFTDPDVITTRASSTTGWKCERCGHTFWEGWDE